ncbi:hypothetical protein [Dyadobacter chenhuakuii]|uniref:Uncharacterized protein n=1 Tax=Dyadobacter chenhuakuii TaxID=2909339 RepID=A0A9X1U2Z8_9BACT|nr:hypothetical protein [Dyadobacter chenhuakuii]MCF2501041.1 hypothetical protein [Dyadobacter chenhuakuii]
MTLWRIHLKPASKTGFDSRKYCLDNNIVGCGWPIPNISSPITSDAYYSNAKELYLAHNYKSWHSAWNAINNKMEVGDLVWTRMTDGNYYLGRITSNWRYDYSISAIEANICNIRSCEWVKVGLVDKVPGKVVSSFIPARTLQAVNGETVSKYSQLVYNELTKQLHYDVNSFSDVFSLLSSSDLEDVIGLYLQISLGYLLFPSSCKSDTLAYEYELVHRETKELAVVQVKSGNESLDRDKYRSIDGKVFLFACNGQYFGEEYSHVTCFEPQHIKDFMLKNWKLLPRSINFWLNRFSSASS